MNEDFPLTDYVVTIQVPQEMEIKVQSLGHALDQAMSMLEMVREHSPAAYISRVMEKRFHTPLSIPHLEEAPPRGRPPTGSTLGTPTIRARVMTDAIAKVA